jgi:pimeloyl-ACP methyl ester carboxylesterase
VKGFRTIAWIALASGVLAAVIVPLVIPVTSSGTLSAREVAPETATFREVNTLEVHYEFREYQGESSTPPLFVLLHGFGASTYSFREVLDDFAMLGDVIAYDRPAFGFTARPTSFAGASPYGSNAQLELISGVVDAFGSPDQAVILVGHSAGGTLAGEYASRYPEEVQGLILVAPAILTTGGGPGWLSWLYNVPQINRLGPLLVQGIATSGSELLERSWHDVNLLTPEIRAGYQRPLEIEGWEAAFWEFQKAPRDFGVSEAPDSISTPTIIITGDDDRVVATSDSIALAEIIGSSQLFVIPQSGHLPHEETPREFMDAVVQGLANWAGGR